ncbi:ABC-type dipeptide/oligopeptide/nickel transport system ATPase component/ABC-type dipeptide/oligopeptide/nickel transport system permease subunit [Okibacterium sp. HSC-33S16]|uniref:dipeptide/oligopeptide/nickel ABC transporter permease/ATP-binding protein n=1 Tax=Okibacterium sp. HSC-33S16 TaxID=2910965 RepID=UPI0020A0E710|nr:dipeptide/oligopeptide/nickel ABC transporter permease/ATP-binding protein [Okibacterium sp. HSC-33S16]MCP2031164.1 ABC-type dipeptide/oligopeptide/nickel transport system ATPase component/ABC-type dipeptide/oligopeptide/nickel transport system permease subunit [Okibacterium sp. HSC-33S16]
MIDLTPATIPPKAQRTSLFVRLLKNPVGLASMIFLTLLVLSAIFAPLLTSVDPNQASLQDFLGPAREGHPLGFDSAGRDVFARLVYAGRFSLAGGLLALVIAAVIGVIGGLLAGYYRGWFDSVSSWLAGLLMAMPAIVVLLAARAVLGPSMWLSMAIFGVMLSPAFFRLVYASVTAVRDELYIDAARVSGLSDGSIIGRHILTVVRAPAIIQSAMVLGIAIAIQAGLDFLGLGDMTIPTWGTMLNDGFTNIYKEPLLILWPSLILALTCMALTLLANAMRDELERSAKPKKRKPLIATALMDFSKVAAVTHADDARTAALTGEVLLNISDLSVGYGQPDGSVKTVVHDVSLTVRRGEVHGLIGESGSGKTQTAWSILRLLPEGGHITGGAIVFEGKDLAEASEREMDRIRGKKIAYIPQEPMSNLDSSFTIGSQLVEPMRICLGISKKEATKRALELLSHVGIPNPQRTFNAYPHEVSGGMAQRVLIAGAISCEPDLLIADEPTTALDVTVQAEILQLLRRLQAELNMGVVLVTHNFGVVADLCDRVSVMREGRVIESGPVRAIFKAARHPYTQSLLNAILEEGEPRGELIAPTTRATTQGAQS